MSDMRVRLSRRRMFKALVGVGVALSPLLSRAAVEITKMGAAIFFEPHVPTALRRARRAQILIEWWPGGD